MVKRLILIFLMLAAVGFGANYYVDPNAAGDDDGTSETDAWETLAGVNAYMGSFNAGDNIYFKYGETFTSETLAIT